MLDQTGQFLDHCDGLVSDRAEIEAAFAMRRALLSSDLMNAEDPYIRLLSYMYVSGGKLVPHYDPRDRSYARYTMFAPVASVQATAERLCHSGFASRELFDRFHVCGSCRSSRLNVREECMSCRSPDLTTSTLLHHFKCSRQGPEQDFRRDTGPLVCPKCASELRHYGTDYERSGTVMVCGGCSHSGTKTAVGFKCLDCEAHYDSEAVETRNVYGYVITAAGTAYLKDWRHKNANAQTAPLQTVLPLALVAAIKQTQTAKDAVTVAELGYHAQQVIAHSNGADFFDRSRSLFLENLRTELSDDCKFVAGQTYDYVVIPRANDTTVKESFTKAIGAASSLLEIDLGVTPTVVNAADLL